MYDSISRRDRTDQICRRGRRAEMASVCGWHTRACMCDFTHPPEASQSGRAAAARRVVRAQAFTRADDQRPRGAVVAEPAGLYGCCSTLEVDEPPMEQYPD